jgi:hypothetical protein
MQHDSQSHRLGDLNEASVALLMSCATLLISYVALAWLLLGLLCIVASPGLAQRIGLHLEESEGLHTETAAEGLCSDSLSRAAERRQLELLPDQLRHPMNSMVQLQ